MCACPVAGMHSYSPNRWKYIYIIQIAITLTMRTNEFLFTTLRFVFYKKETIPNNNNNDNNNVYLSKKLLLMHLLLHSNYTKFQVWNKRVVGFPCLLNFRTSFDGFFKPSKELISCNTHIVLRIISIASQHILFIKREKEREVE